MKKSIITSTRSLFPKFALSILIAAFVNSNAYCRCKDKPIQIAVVDTGFGYDNAEFHGTGARLCKTGHKDFSSDNTFTTTKETIVPVPKDFNSHGTNIVGIIEDVLKPAHTNYCIVILKYFGSNQYHYEAITATVEAFEYATAMKFKYVNYSSGGRSSFGPEKEAVLKYLNSGGTLVVAAGNDGQDLDSPLHNYYPAKYDRRIIVVGSLDRDGVKLYTSNYGSIVNRWELGLGVVGYGLIMSGTSQATAIATGKIASQNKNKCDIGK